MAVTAQQPLVLRFGGKLVEQLGAQLYPRVTSSVAELVSNAWDADAHNVWIKIPFDEDWKNEAVIEVIDDGNGMTYEMARLHYLVVGRNRRLDSETSEGGRRLHGRKGIGKLAAFGTAAYLECVTLRDGVVTAFGIDYDDLRTYEPSRNYPVEIIDDPDPLLHPTTREPLEHGTRIRLSKLRAKRKTGEAAFRRSMERRFALDATVMKVFINGGPLQRFQTPVEIRFPTDGRPPKARITAVEDGWARETIPYPTEEHPDATREVRWWMGFTDKPIADEDVRGVSILSRGKLAQRPFMFERAQGTTGQLAQEYLIGEVIADWLDHGVDAADDLIQSNRDQLQLDNAELEQFLEWGRELLRWCMARRNEIRRDRSVGAGALGEHVESVITAAPPASRQRLRTLAGRIAEITQGEQRDVATALQAVVDATHSKVIERAGDELRLDADPDAEATWRHLDDARAAVRDELLALHRVRHDAIGHFLLAVQDPPAARLHRKVATDPWIVSPLLADVPRKVVRDDDDACVLRFVAVGAVLDELTLTCFAVGHAPSDDELVEGLAIASSWPDPSPRRLTWVQALAGSAAAHELLIGSLTESSS